MIRKPLEDGLYAWSKPLDGQRSGFLPAVRDRSVCPVHILIPLTVLIGDCRNVLKTLPAESVHCCIASPSFRRLRDYGFPSQIGREPAPEGVCRCTPFRLCRGMAHYAKRRHTLVESEAHLRLRLAV